MNFFFFLFFFCITERLQRDMRSVRFALIPFEKLTPSDSLSLSLSFHDTSEKRSKHYSHELIWKELVRCLARYSHQKTTRGLCTMIDLTFYSFCLSHLMQTILQNPGLKSWKWFVDLSHVEFKKDKEEVLGEGKFSKCILGKLYGTYVAVKKFKREASTVNQFQSEGLCCDEVAKQPNDISSDVSTNHLFYNSWAHERHPSSKHRFILGSLLSRKSFVYYN